MALAAICNRGSEDIDRASAMCRHRCIAVDFLTKPGGVIQHVYPDLLLKKQVFRRPAFNILRDVLCGLSHATVWYKPPWVCIVDMEPCLSISGTLGIRQSIYWMYKWSGFAIMLNSHCIL